LERRRKKKEQELKQGDEVFPPRRKIERGGENFEGSMGGVRRKINQTVRHAGDRSKNKTTKKGKTASKEKRIEKTSVERV